MEMRGGEVEEVEAEVEAEVEVEEGEGGGGGGGRKWRRRSTVPSGGDHCGEEGCHGTAYARRENTTVPNPHTHNRAPGWRPCASGTQEARYA